MTVTEVDGPIDETLMLESVEGRFPLAVKREYSDRKWPILLMFVILVLGMAFMLWWPTLVDHRQGWETGGDMWGIFRAAHYIGWGFLVACTTRRLVSTLFRDSKCFWRRLQC